MFTIVSSWIQIEEPGYFIFWDTTVLLHHIFFLFFFFCLFGQDGAANFYCCGTHYYFICVSHTSALTTLCCLMCRVKMAWDREDCAFMLVLAVVRDNAPIFKHCIVCNGEINKYHWHLLAFIIKTPANSLSCDVSFSNWFQADLYSNQGVDEGQNGSENSLVLKLK